MSSKQAGPTSQPSLKVDGVTVRYGALVALENVNWQVRGGEILGIIGPNGAGKSSCFAAVTNCISHGGEVLLDGSTVSGLSTHKLARRGLRRTFQQNSFFGDLNVLQNAMAALVLYQSSPLYEAVLLPWRQWRQGKMTIEHAKMLLEDFNIGPEHFEKLPSEIPYGIQRLLSIALAHAQDARVMLLDEPAAGVGGGDMQRLVELLLRLKKRGLALVVIEHHMDLIMSVADRIIVIDSGRFLAEGPPVQIQQNPEVIEAYLGRTE